MSQDITIITHVTVCKTVFVNLINTRERNRRELIKGTLFLQNSSAYTQKPAQKNRVLLAPRHAESGGTKSGFYVRLKFGLWLRRHHVEWQKKEICRH